MNTLIYLSAGCFAFIAIYCAALWWETRNEHKIKRDENDLDIG